MKSFVFILLVSITSLSIVSCSKDDDDTNTNNAQLIGTWLLTGESENGESLELGECDFIITITNTQIISEDFSGDNCMESDTFTTGYSRNGNIITITGEDSGVEIVTLNATTLVIKYTEEDDGETFEYLETYTRQ